jgi:tRNA modification GTPase
LENILSKHFACEPEPGEVVVTSARHAACLEAAINSLGHAAEALTAGLSGDLVMVDLRAALRSLGDITGNGASEEILDRVFSTFCIGK